MRRASLLGDEEIRRWYENLRRGAKVTADHYLARLGHVCETFEVTPGSISSMSPRQAYSFLLDIVTAQEARGLAGSHIKGVLKAVKSWLRHNDVAVDRDINVNGADDTPTLVDERVPELDELKAMFRFCDARAAAAVSLMAFSGLRPASLGDYEGNDGIRIRDFVETRLDTAKGAVEFLAVPTMVLVRKNLSKTSNQYFTFLCEEGCLTVKAYLEKRISDGKGLTADSPVISSDDEQPLTSKAISAIVRKPIRRAGFAWRPYVLRCFYDTRMMQAEGRAEIGLVRDWRKFFMGHKGDIEHRYTVNKHQLPPSLIEEMREAYRRASEAYLQTMSLPRSRHIPIRTEFRQLALSAVGFSEEEMRDMQFEKMTSEQLQEYVRQRLSACLNGNTARRQLVVSSKKAQEYINLNGWRFVGTMPDGKVVIEHPQASDPI